MKVLWGHDHKFYYFNERVYSKVQFSQEFWERYLYHFNEVNVLSRMYQLEENEKEDVNNYNISSHSDVNFHSLNFSNKIIDYLKNRKFRKIKVKKLVSSHEKIIVRLPSIIGIYIGLEALKQKKDLAVELVGDPWEAYMNIGSIKGKLFAPPMYLLTRYLVKKAKQVLYVTEKNLQKRYPNKKSNNINASNVNININSDSPKFKRLNKKESYEIGLIGYLSEYKGIDTALYAIKELNESRNSKYYLNILGTGDKETFYKTANDLNIKEYVNVKSLPNGKPVFQWLDNLDIYIQPSKTEGLPRGLVEAMSLSIPAIGSNVGGIPELLNDKFIIKKGDYKNLANLIDQILNSEELYNQASLTNYEISKKYDIKVLNKKRYQFYKNFKGDNIK